VCLDYPTFLEHIDPLNGKSAEALDEELDKFVSEIVNAKVIIDTDQGSITLPSVMDEYRADFGGTDEKILEFIFHYLEEEYDMETLLQQLKEKTMIIKYE
jgi:tetrahydromethanopterin S-methyltransferase subunit H